MSSGPKTRKVNIHPASLKHIKKGHPWITADTFTKKFPKGEEFLQVDEAGIKLLLLNDPQHPNVKARVWGFGDGRDLRFNFPRELKERMAAAFNKRKNSGVSEKRDNFYLVFGEADLIPGLFIQALGGHALVQTTSNFWIIHKKRIAELVRELWEEHFPERPYINGWWSDRATEAKSKTTALKQGTNPPEEIILQEYGVNYILRPNDAHDPGLYTDMAAVREHLIPLFESSKSVLNLYSYTGAYSLFALKQGANDVHSVDLSQKYLDWLEDNLKENNDLNSEFHHSHTLSVEEALKKFKTEGKKFDLIICDPPSASSDGKKMAKASDTYIRDLPLIHDLLNDEGHAVVFLNTHQLGWKKFNQKLDDVVSNRKLKLKSVEQLRLMGDCPLKGGFQEGDYLKGRVFQRLK